MCREISDWLYGVASGFSVIVAVMALAVFLHAQLTVADVVVGRDWHTTVDSTNELEKKELLGIQKFIIIFHAMFWFLLCVQGIIWCIDWGFRIMRGKQQTYDKSGAIFGLIVSFTAVSSLFFTMNITELPPGKPPGMLILIGVFFIGLSLWLYFNEKRIVKWFNILEELPPTDNAITSKKEKNK